MWKKSEQEVTPSVPVKNLTPTSNRKKVCIGPGLSLKGELSGNEDVIIEGRVEGKVTLKGHSVIIEKSGRVGSLELSLSRRNHVAHGWHEQALLQRGAHVCHRQRERGHAGDTVELHIVDTQTLLNETRASRVRPSPNHSERTRARATPRLTVERRFQLRNRTAEYLFRFR